jgi:hypothetical protein
MIFQMTTVGLVLKLMMTFLLLSAMSIVVGFMADNLDSPFCKRFLALSSVFAILATLLMIVYYWMI